MAIQAPWTSTMMKTWQTSVMHNLAIPSLAFILMLLVISWHPAPSSNLSTYLPSSNFYLTPSTYLLQLQPTITAIIHLPSAFSFSILASNPIISLVRPPHACHILTGGTIFLGDLVLSILPCHWNLALGYPHANPVSSSH